MGYMTSYKLMILDPRDPRVIRLSRHYEVLAALKAQVEYADFALNRDGDTNEECKWYDAIADLREFSKQYPDDLFVLQGFGEEAGDMWIAYFLGGNTYQQPAKITFAPYSEALAAWGMPVEPKDYQPDYDTHGRNRVQVYKVPALPGPTIQGECHQ